MPSKKELSDAINEALGTTVDWTRLTSKDLEQVVALINDPTGTLIKAGVVKVRDKAKTVAVGLIDRIIDNAVS